MNISKNNIGTQIYLRDNVSFIRTLLPGLNHTSYLMMYAYEYNIQLAYNQNGTCILRFHKVPPQHTTFTNKLFPNIPIEKIIEAELDTFYPLGKIPRPEHMRKGIGSDIFKKIIRDCAQEGAHILYISTNSDIMKSFLAKHEFCNRQPASYLYYKTLYPKSI
ncbi:MAG: hypothetical protein AABX52_01245 [Nanoarchaeota archaeon]